MKRLVHEELSSQIRGLLMEVHNTLGPGFREETYKIAVLTEAQRRQFSVEREVSIDVAYKGQVIDQFRLDLVVERSVILELKAVDELHPRHRAQLLSYPRASGLQLGQLVNFCNDRLEIIRLVNEKHSEKSASSA